jgi:hypothetical protein
MTMLRMPIGWVAFLAVAPSLGAAVPIRVRAHDGTAVEKAKITIEMAESKDPIGAVGQTDKDGLYVSQDLPGAYGNVSITVDPPPGSGLRPVTYNVSPKEGQEIPIRLPRSIRR